ncbi:MAG: sporulation integral membrane protein YtvI [Clostridiales bacterium]|nr:sporulation integral membrane protein YtvI [Clostridiales bacterium]MBS6943716.1 sporulation integral membrane protein YtvI [Clostridiales bacterium]
MQERKRIFVDTPFLKAAELPLLMLITVVVVALCYVLASYVMPLLLAILISTAMEPLVRMLSGTNRSGEKVRGGLPRKVAVLLVMLIVFTLLITVGFFIIQGVVSELISLAESLPAKIPQWMESLDQLGQQISAQFPIISTENLASIIQSLSGHLTESITTIAASAVSFVTQMPAIILFIVFTIMSTYFFSVSRFSIMRNLKRQLPQSWQETAQHLYGTLAKALFGWLKAQFIILCCMFLVMFIGFTILNVHYALLIALGIAVMDALPILGSGLVMIPWIGYQLFFGSLPMGIGLALIYVLLIFTRQSIEPRVVGGQFGLPPLWTMCAMYAGFRLFGFIGLFLGPLTLLLMYNVAKMYLQKRTYREVLADVAAQWSPPPDL